MVAAFRDAFPEAAVLVTAVSDPDSRPHGANESLHLGDFERACVAEALMLERFAERSRREHRRRRAGQVKGLRRPCRRRPRIGHL